MMNRREFLAAGVTAAIAPKLTFFSPQARPTVVFQASDEIDLLAPTSSRFRILQLTDTHFGTSTPEARVKGKLSQALIRELVAAHEPDFIFHTGDFINNDQENPEHDAIEFMAGLGRPWSVVFGNHDHPNGKAGQKSLDEYYQSLEGAVVGYAEPAAGKRDYCFRINLRRDGASPFATILAFNTGDPQSGMKVNESQTSWMQARLDADRAAGAGQPIFVMQHIPTVEFHHLYEDEAAIGRQGEKVCFELDEGEIYARWKASGRVRAVFCGHDHVNDYIGKRDGIALAYGRCSGFNGYGDWQRGARLIDINPMTGKGSTRVVLAKDAAEKTEWSLTLEPTSLG
jgi:3',5'-cyclic AMP phosphodiesterase CpdA